jgi:hypothetical protein
MPEVRLSPQSEARNRIRNLFGGAVGQKATDAPCRVRPRYAEDPMLRRINAAVFEGPTGARVQVVAEAESNNGVTDARFEYAGAILPREQINGLPGCTFTVGTTPQRLQAIVAFDDNAPGTARYDLAEFENGVANNLGKFTLKSDGSPLIDFVIDPIAVAVSPGAMPPAAPRVAGVAAAAAPPPAPTSTGARKSATKRAAAPKKGSRKRAASGTRKTTRAAKKTARESTRKSARKASGATASRQGQRSRKPR